MSDRTAVWLKDIIAGRRSLDKTIKERGQFAIFAPVLPISVELQRFYLEQLGDEMRSEIQGLAMYDPLSITKIPKELENLPRLSMSEPANPQCILREIQHGLDIFTIPFIGIATDAGIALDFSFPVRPPEPMNGTILRKPLGVDMRPSSHARDLSPLRPECKCYACTKHHRAYLQHLLAANEMLGWVLLQIHNHQVVDEFFAGTRASIGAGTFDEDYRVFEKFYDPDLPERTGQGPRVRGYQCKSEGPSELKKNPTAYGRLDDVREKLAEAVSLPSPAADAKDFEDQGFAKAV
ncbi:hypothetical protein B0A49_06531 [Cryomyces minteri]|uniref:tRNA-guanine(15) transglycosylase-like domain-containing protein n=1 Tax=Cryomyces minteri TaxID=331657 RepID=A0A4U0WRA0_9PEZI|nr:hypothetical protein B0A49_06531 [Cryomyces minteri]